MHLVRWILTTSWLVLIASLFYDPLSPWLTQPDNVWSPLRIDPNLCVKVQGVCLKEQPYPLGTTIFWGAIVPISIFILLIFGHELWRRICPLSFLSQIPRALGWQRQIKHVNPTTGKARYELPKVKPGSWLGRNYLYLQFGLLYAGLCARILFINSNRLALAAWFIATIAAAIAVGYFYGGKSWCNYFCPMSPVQSIYAEPGGLLASQAHIGDQKITQSMCRTVTDEGKEQSACVACQTPCIDIDAERAYWDAVTQPKQKQLYYGYVGLVVGYFCYYYLYAGNWAYYFSGAWAHQENQLDTLLKPGLYLFGTPIPIPKLMAVPLVLGGFSIAGHLVGQFLAHRYQDYLQRTKQPLSPEIIQHRLFTLCTFAVFNFFFIFGGRPLILLLPLFLQFFYEGLIVGLSTLWLYRTWQRNPDRYARESLATRLRRQLSKLQLNVAQFLEGRSLEDLNTDEVYVLAKVVPGFTKEKRHQAYKGVLREALEEGYVNTASSLEVLQQMRAELDISEEEHRQVLEELGVEDPELLDPTQKRSRENLVRLTGYRKALERMVTLQQRQTADLTDAPPTPLSQESEALQLLRREYAVTQREEQDMLNTLNPSAVIGHRAEALLNQLENLIQRYHALNQPLLHNQETVLILLRTTVLRKKRLLVTALLEIIEHLSSDPTPVDGSEPPALWITRALEKLSPGVLQDILAESANRQGDGSSWHQRLTPEILTLLTQPAETPTVCSLALPLGEIATQLDALVFEPNPLIQAISLFLLYQLDAPRGQERAKYLLTQQPQPLIRDVATTMLALADPATATLTTFVTLEKLVYLSNSDFFGEVHSETLVDLANRAVIKVYQPEEMITEAGDTCRELLLLMEGRAHIRPEQDPDAHAAFTQALIPGQVLDELEVLSHAQQASTIVAKAQPTRILAIPVDTFDDLLERDRDFARRVLEMESRRLQQLINL
ncbi:MAG: cyclic nucleotide-binding domain-containing protein [Thermosynechococcaceae cyanobacterium]